MIKICIVCKHEEAEHYIGTISKIPVCDACRDLSWFDEYHEFKLDNLKYLEDKYVENNK